MDARKVNSSTPEYTSFGGSAWVENIVGLGSGLAHTYATVKQADNSRQPANTPDAYPRVDSGRDSDGETLVAEPAKHVDDGFNVKPVHIVAGLALLVGGVLVAKSVG